MVRANEDIRLAAYGNGLKLWQVAAAYGVNDGNFSRLLRHELPPEKKQEIFEIIARLAEE